MDMDQAEAMLQSHRVEDITEKIEPQKIRKIISKIILFYCHSCQSKVDVEENGKALKENNDDLKGPIIEINREDKDPTYFLFSLTLWRTRIRAYMKKGKNLKINFGQKVLSVSKEVEDSTCKTLRKKREDYLTMVRQIKRIQLHNTETIF